MTRQFEIDFGSVLNVGRLSAYVQRELMALQTKEGGIKKEKSRFRSDFGNKIMLLMKKTDSSMRDLNWDSCRCVEKEETLLSVLLLYYTIGNF